MTKIAKATKGIYVDGNNTKTVLEEIKKVLDSTQKSEFESKLMANYQSQFQWFLGFAFLLLFVDLFFLERKTKWIQDLNLFNEKEKNR